MNSLTSPRKIAPKIDPNFKRLSTDFNNEINKLNLKIKELTEQLEQSNNTETVQRLNDEIKEFSTKYQTFFKKLTDPIFCQDQKNINVIKQMIIIKSAQNDGTLSETEAKAQCADIALNSLVERVKSKQ